MCKNKINQNDESYNHREIYINFVNVFLEILRIFVSLCDVKRSLFVLFTRLIKDCLRHNINASTCTLKGR